MASPSLQWNTEPFIKAHELVQDLLLGDGSRGRPAVLQAVKDVLPDLRALLSNPPKSEQSRAALQKATIVLDGEECKVNEEFIQVAVAVADELSLDELVAAQLVHYALSDVGRLGMAPGQGGLALFYVRRQYVLDLVRFILLQASSPSNLPIFQQIVDLWVEDSTGRRRESVDLVDSVLAALRQVEQGFADLEVKEKRGQFLGQSTDSDFIATLKIRRNFLLREHDNLGQILYWLVAKQLVDPKAFVNGILPQVGAFPSYNTLFVHYIPSVLLYISSLDPDLTGTSYTTSFNDATSVYNAVFAELKPLPTSGPSLKLPSVHSKFQYWQHALSLALASSYSGSCRTQPIDVASKIPYDATVLAPSRQAIDAGAFEFFMTLAADTSPMLVRKPHLYDYRPSVQQRIPSLHSIGELSGEFYTILTAELERFVTSFVSNLADLLKEMRLSEEDSFLEMQESHNSRRQTAPEELPGVDLERFFIFISYLYSDRPEASAKFWSDAEGSLHGFLVWALRCHVSFMSTTLCDMLASLACGSSSALAVHRLLGGQRSSSDSSVVLESANPRTDSIMPLAASRRSYELSWNEIFDSFDYYAEQVTDPQGRNSTLKVMSRLGGKAKRRTNPSNIELDDDAMLLLSAHCRLIESVARNSPEALQDMLSWRTKKSKLPLVNVIFRLMSIQTALYGSLFSALSGLAESKSPETATAIWTALDEWAFHSVIYMEETGSLEPKALPGDRLNQLLRSSSDIVGFITLVETLMRPRSSTPIAYPFPFDLGAAYRNPGVSVYIDFIVSEVFLSSALPGFTTEERMFLQLPCLRFIQHCLEMLDPQMVQMTTTLGLADAGALAKLTPGATFASYLERHPCGPMMSHLFDSRVYNLLIAITSTGYDLISERGNQSRSPVGTVALAGVAPSVYHDGILDTLVHSIRIINDVLDRQQVFVDVLVREFKFTTHGLRMFEDAILFNLPVVTYLAHYLGSSNAELASRSLELLQRLSVSPQFCSASTGSGTGARKSRMLSALETVEDRGIAIKEGFIEQLERPLDEYETSPWSPSSLSKSGMKIKISLLDFLLTNLREHAKIPNIAHFLLGFNINSDGSLGLDELRCGIASETSVFSCVLSLLKFMVDSISLASDVNEDSSRVASACMEIILLLTQDPLSSSLILPLLREGDFALSRLNAEPVIDRTNTGDRTRWNGLSLPSAGTSASAEFVRSGAADSVVAFLRHRAALLEYISLEIHDSAIHGSLSLVSRYLKTLVNLENYQRSSRSRSAMVLSFLDVVEVFGQDVSHLYSHRNGDSNGANQLSNEAIELLGADFIQLSLEFAQESSDGNDSGVWLVEEILNIKGQELTGEGKIVDVRAAESKAKTRVEFDAVKQNVLDFYLRAVMMKRIREYQLDCLKAWSKLVLVLLSDTEMSTATRMTFVLETLQALIAKLMDFSSSDVEFAEVLASLMVSLQQSYQEDAGGESPQLVDSYDRSYALFRASLESILVPLSTPELRTNLYMICYRYLRSIQSSGPKSSQSVQSLQVIRAAGDKLLERVCADSLQGEGVVRLAALVFLKVVYSLCSTANATFVQDGLVRYNLLLLLVKSVQRLDGEITSARESEGIAYSGGMIVTDDVAQLVYDFKVLEATLCFVLEVARTRSGAVQLIQSSVFDVLDQCRFLDIDLDVGIQISGVDAADQAVVSLYNILVPVFQVLSAIVLSMGPDNEPVLERLRQFLHNHQRLVVAVLKLDMLQRDGAKELQDLAKLVVLLISLVGYGNA